MPWSESDVERHNKGLNAKQKRQWVHVANGCLEAGDDDGTAITKANGAVKKDRIQEMFEDLLYEKLAVLLQSVRLQEAANILNEADPLPRVEIDYQGNPLVPSREQYLNYFEGMQSNFIADRLERARQQWEAASKDTDSKLAAAKLKAMNLEMEIGNSVLNGKRVSEEVVNPMGPHIVKPTVQKDFKGNPTVPSREEYFRYFDAMPVGQLASHMRMAQQTLQAASQASQKANLDAQTQKSASSILAAKNATAHLRAVGIEMAVGNSMLKNKQRTQQQGKKKFDKNRAERHKKIGKAVTNFASGFSPLAGFVAKHATNLVLNRGTKIATARYLRDKTRSTI